MRRRLLSLLAALARRLGLGERAYLLFRSVRALRRPGVLWRNARIRRQGAPDGLPLPPDRLMILVATSPDVHRFLEGGRQAAATIEAAAERAGQPLHAMASILDFGCGCGRVLRHWRDLPDTRIVGVDRNPRLVDWVDAGLPFCDASVCGAEPPLAFPDDDFDLAYALSVLTHLTEHSQRRWMAELRRVLRPGGLLLVTTHGAAYRDLMTADEQRRFDRGELVVSQAEYEGSNVCAAFHPHRYFRDVTARDFAVLEHRIPMDGGCGSQELWVLQA